MKASSGWNDGTNTTLNSGRIQINLKEWKHMNLSPGHLWDGLTGQPNWSVHQGERSTARLCQM